MNVSLSARYYEQFDADFRLEIPAEGFGGWKETSVEIACEHTALVVMHAWNFGQFSDYPGWHRAVEYVPRAQEICRTIFPPIGRSAFLRNESVSCG